MSLRILQTLQAVLTIRQATLILLTVVVTLAVALVVAVATNWAFALIGLIALPSLALLSVSSISLIRYVTFRDESVLWLYTYVVCIIYSILILLYIYNMFQILSFLIPIQG